MSEGTNELRALGSERTRYDYDEPRPDLLERIPSPAADGGIGNRDRGRAADAAHRCPALLGEDRDQQHL